MTEIYILKGLGLNRVINTSNSVPFTGAILVQTLLKSTNNNLDLVLY